MIQFRITPFYSLSFFVTIMFWIRYEMGWNYIVYDQDPTWWRPGKFAQIENTWVWSTQNGVRIVRQGHSSEDIYAQLSKVEDDGEKEHRSETQIAKLWRQAREKWNRSSGQESKGLKWRWKKEEVFVTSEKKKGQVSKGDQCSFSHECNDRAKPTPKTEPPSQPQSSKTRGRSVSRKRSVRGRSQSEKFNRPPCKDFLKGTCTKSPCEYWHPPECQFYKTESGCKFGAECSFPLRKFEEQPNKRPKKRMQAKVQLLLWKVYDSWVVYHRTLGRQILQRFLGRAERVLEPIRRVRFTRAALRQANVRENRGPSLGKIQVKNPHRRSPYAMKFEDRSQEETERQQGCARGKAWNLAKTMYKLKEKEKATFNSLSEEWVMPAASTKEPEEREFVVDSRTSMHMVRKKELNSAELETMRMSRNPTTVMTANGEVQTREEATVYVKELDLFVTVMPLEETLRSYFARETQRGSWVYLPLDRRSKTTSNNVHS